MKCGRGSDLTYFSTSVRAKDIDTDATFSRFKYSNSWKNVSWISPILFKKKKKKRLVPGKEILTNTTIVYVDVWSEACEMFRLVRECDREVQLWQTDPNMTLVLISNPAGEAGIQRDPITSFIGPQRAPS